jgi:hypothetical protein
MECYGDSNLDLDERLPTCPNCGGVLKSRYIGNMYGKKRKIQVKCKNVSCRIERTDAALNHDFVWLENCQLEAWNTRAALKED